ncbi:hypothetical protein KFE25_006857 [Diacronema lutheri]|uniref:Uncharacterized protein n=2 Tax=Diacronema lutheri TaxID=2081491 RepID=A0A8J5XTT9_DIALT|nr:hypothetical protein KFE25_006857 [Diacronema lutheri]
MERRAPPVFADDVPARRMVRPFAERSSMTAFEQAAAPMPSESASETSARHKKHFDHAAVPTGSTWAPRGADPSMYVTTAMGGGIVDAERDLHHRNGTRKVTSKRMVQPSMIADAQRNRLVAAQAAERQPQVAQVDRRIASFAGSFAGFAAPQRQ